jgi:hypothetical protein
VRLHLERDLDALGGRIVVPAAKLARVEEMDYGDSLGGQG